MHLTSFSEVRRWATAIREAVLARPMPPWHADPAIGHFRNDLSRTPPDIATLQSWVDAGAPEGDPSDAPPARQFAAGWRISKPDVVFELPAPNPVPARGVLEHQSHESPPHFQENRSPAMPQVLPTPRL